MTISLKNIAIQIVILASAGTTSLVAQEIQTTGSTKDPAAEPTPAPIVENFEQRRTMSVGLLGMYNLSISSATALKLPEVASCCPGYSGGSGGSFAIGFEASIPLSTRIELLPRLIYQASTGSMAYKEPTTVRQNNIPVASFMQHDLTTSMNFILFEPGVEYAVSDDFRLIGGLRFGILSSATYEQQEMLDPSIPYDYEDGTGTRNVTSGDIAGTSSFQFGVYGGARYHLYLNERRTLELIPEVQVAPFFTSLMADQSWNVLSIRFGVGLAFNLMGKFKASNPLRPK